MTEDSRISEIREALAKFEATDVAWPLMQEVPAVSALVDSLGEILDRLAPASQVFLPGELIPGGMVTQNEHGTITHCAMSLRSSTTEVRLRTAAHRLSPEEWQAAIDRARVEREAAP